MGLWGKITAEVVATAIQFGWQALFLHRVPVLPHIHRVLQHDIVQCGVGATATHGDIKLEEGAGVDLVVPGLGISHATWIDDQATFQAQRKKIVAPTCWSVYGTVSIRGLDCECSGSCSPFLLNSSALSSELQVSLGTAFMAMYQMSLCIGWKFSWKPWELVSLTAMMTSSMAHSALWLPGSKTSL